MTAQPCPPCPAPPARCRCGRAAPVRNCLVCAPAQQGGAPDLAWPMAKPLLQELRHTPGYFSPRKLGRTPKTLRCLGGGCTTLQWSPRKPPCSLARSFQYSWKEKQEVRQGAAAPKAPPGRQNPPAGGRALQMWGYAAAAPQATVLALSLRLWPRPSRPRGGCQGRAPAAPALQGSAMTSSNAIFLFTLARLRLVGRA